MPPVPGPLEQRVREHVLDDALGRFEFVWVRAENSRLHLGRFRSLFGRGIEGNHGQDRVHQGAEPPPAGFRNGG
jgi:hypothetical protein